MARVSPFVVNVADLLGEQGLFRDEYIETKVDWGIELSRTNPDVAMTADLRLSATAGGLVARGTVKVPVRHTCVRCLDEIEETLDVKVTELFSDGSFEVEDGDYVVERDVVDLEQMIRDNVVLALPLTASCGDDCPGLGAQTQSDLNAARSEATRESPFAVLKDLLEPGASHRDEVADGGT